MDKSLFRAGSSDENICNSVIRDNEYKLPDAFEPTDLVVDVGACIGAFAYACVQRGAGRVMCFEPDPENFWLLRQHLSQEISDGKVETFPFAVAENLGFRTFSGVVRKDGETNHGGAYLFSEKGDSYGLAEYIVNQPFRVLAIPFSLINMTGIPDGFTRRLLKLDCENSEHEIIQSFDVSEFPQIAGEYHAYGGHSGESLKARLEELGFAVGLFPWRDSELGLFQARRK